jgi:hypothetical protein
MRRLIGIARLMLAEMFRMKIAVVVIFFLAAILAAIPFILETDDTQPGHVKLTLTYSISILIFLLSALTIFLSAFAVSSKVKGEQMLLLDSKPVQRWEVMLGKWTGIMFLNLLLIAVMGTIIWGLAKYVARPSAGTAADQEEIRTEVLTARRTVFPDPPVVSDQQVERAYNLKLEAGRLPDDHLPSLEKEKIKADFIRWNMVVPFGFPARWTFSGINPEKNAKIFFIYKATASSTTTDDFLYGTWFFGREYSDNWFGLNAKETFDSPHEIELPQEVLDETGELIVRFRNETPPYKEKEVMAAFTEDDSLRVLYRSGPFGQNFIKAMLMIFIMLGFLAAVGIALGSLFSFQVAAYILVVMLICSTLIGSVKSEVTRPITLAPGLGPEAPVSEKIISNPVVQLFYRGVFLMVPEILKYSPVNLIATGNDVSWNLISRAFFVLFLFKAGLVGLVGWYFFNRKELATAASQMQ